jgi:hypothetical protein
MMSNITDHQRYEDVIITELTKVDSKGWVGIKTEEHGEIRCKSNLRTKLGLKKKWEGDLTVWVNPNSSVVCVAFDQKAYLATGDDARPNGQWQVTFNNNPYEAEGFIYTIFERSTGKSYIGKKSYWNYSKGKRVRQSNWKTYASSSSEIAERVASNKDDYGFIMLHEAPDKSALNYLEIKYQLEYNVLTAVDDKGEKLYYNKTLGSERWMLTKSFIEEYNGYNEPEDYATRQYNT